MASVTDKIVSAAPVWTGQLASSIPDGTTTSFSLTSSSGLTDGEVYYFTIDRVDASGNKTLAKKEVIKGKLNGTNVVDCIRGVEGSAQAHSSGATVEILWTAAQWNDLKSHITTEHNQDGTHDSTKVTTRTAFETEHKTDNTHDETKVAMLAGAQTFTGVKTFSSTPKTDAIAEKTTNAGVTIDGLLVKDGTLVFPTCKAIRSTNYTLANAVDTALPLDGERWDTHNMHDNTTNPSRITVPSAGYYLVTAVARFASNTTGGRVVSIKVNNSVTYIQAKRNRQTGAGGTDEINIAGVVKCNANDYIEMFVYQDTGSDLTVYNNSHLIVARLF